eukprot:m.308905 g.308905  ORF g.308905 m.308905 type:complete len:593 (+) comp45030_c0_seq1:34-1812(+)
MPYSLFVALSMAAVVSQWPDLFGDAASLPQQAKWDSLGTLKAILAEVTRSSSSIECDVCKATVFLVRPLLGLPGLENEVVKIISKACVDLHIEDQRVCDGIASEFRPEVFGVLLNSHVTTDEICGALFGDKCGSPFDPLANWTIPIPSNKPPVKPPMPPKSGSPTLKVLHLSDIHHDPEYTEGLDTDCGEPLCCRPPNKHVGPPGGAGKWGDYKCDPPLATVENLFAHLSSSVDFDVVYWTGDIPQHNVWNQSRSDQLHVIDAIIRLMLKYFPGKVIYPAVGNHESAPVNSFPPPFVTGDNSESWLYNALSVNWTAKWLPSATAPTIRLGAFYSTNVSSSFRIISLNTNYCNNGNFWLYINSTDPAGQLQWLTQQLLEAEAAHQKVHILGHIPPNSGDCLLSWSRAYYAIVNRFEGTIAGQFFGHTHVSSVTVFYEQSRATNVAYVGPSVTPYTELNPSFRVYTVDGAYSGSSYSVLDYTDYIMNLTEANLSGAPKWQLESAVRSAYGMEWLFPSDWNDFIQRCKANSTLLDVYYKNHVHSHVLEPCNGTCAASLICDMEHARSHEPCGSSLPGVTEESLSRYRAAKSRRYC